MAIQGIITGFTDKNNLSRNLALVGRGANYILCHDGVSSAGGVFSALDQALPAFYEKASGVCEADWVAIRAVVSNNVNDRYEVTEVGSVTDASQDSAAPPRDEGVIRLLGTIEEVEDPMAEYLPGAIAQEIGFVHMQSIIGEYDDILSVDEWAWLTRHAMLADSKNSLEGDNPSYELVMQLHDTTVLRDAPASLAKVFVEAQKKVLVYLIFAHRKSRLSN